MVVLLYSVMEVHAGCYGNKMRWWMLTGKVSENSVHRFLDFSCRVSSDEAGAWGGAVRASLMESVTISSTFALSLRKPTDFLLYVTIAYSWKIASFVCLFFFLYFVSSCIYMVHMCHALTTLSYPEHPSESIQEDDEKEQRSELQEDG